MSLPTLTPEQREAALARASEVRQARAELKASLKAGTVTLPDVIAKGADDDVIGALALGIGQSLATRYVANILPAKYATGWADALPFLLIIVVLTVRGTALTSRGVSGDRSASDKAAP